MARPVEKLLATCPNPGTDLLGDPFKRPVKYRVNGYFATPGGGPRGETCGSCKHIVKVRRRYLKCLRARLRWTSGYGTDIRAKSPACHAWEADDP